MLGPGRRLTLELAEQVAEDGVSLDLVDLPDRVASLVLPGAPGEVVEELRRGDQLGGSPRGVDQVGDGADVPDHARVGEVVGTAGAVGLVEVVADRAPTADVALDLRKRGPEVLGD